MHGNMLIRQIPLIEVIMLYEQIELILFLQKLIFVILLIIIINGPTVQVRVFHYIDQAIVHTQQLIEYDIFGIMI